MNWCPENVPSCRGSRSGGDKQVRLAEGGGGREPGPCLHAEQLLAETVLRRRTGVGAEAAPLHVWCV